MNNISIDQFRYFLKAAEFQHVGNAARSIPISPSAVSAAISKLEIEVGGRLFERKNKRIILTADGEVLRKKIQEILINIENLPTELEKEKSALRGSYRLAGGHFFVSSLLGRVWGDIQLEHPLLVAEIYSMNPGAIVNEVGLGNLNLGVCLSPKREENIEEIELHRGPLIIAVGNQHPLLKSKKKNPIEALSDYPTAIHRSTHGLNTCHNHPIFKRYDIRPKVSFYYDSDEVAVDILCTKSNYWSLMPDFVVKKSKNRVAPVKLPKDWDATYRLSIVASKSYNQDGGLSLLVNRLRDEVKTFMSFR
jgi:DNA-binding transcriptional LysR family regulator